MTSKKDRVATAIRVELYTQWQTHDNGVHMTTESFAAIDFDALAAVATTAAAAASEPVQSKGVATSEG